MKRLRLLLVVGVFAFGSTVHTSAQVIELPEIEVVATNYKYLNAMGEEVSIPVKTLQDAVADFDLESAEFYQDEYQTYIVSFYIPEGRILASYDGKGNLLRTAERFKNVNVPLAVKQAIGKRYPNWTITKDIYRVSYHSDRADVKRQYKLVLENGDQRIRVKVDEEGEFL